MTLGPARAPRAMPSLALLDDLRPAGELPEQYWDRALLGPAHEFLRRPGKQFRGRLVETAWRLAGGADNGAPAGLPLVVELLHAGSLIVDDIEDDSEERRGSPALHRLVGMPVALNTGNWIYFRALAMLQQAAPPAALPALMARTVDVMMRCHEGQALDLSIRIHDVPQGDVRAVVAATTARKTGALMELAAYLGAGAAGADAEIVEAIASFGHALGVGLQMLDDLGGLTGSARAAKGIEDLEQARPTWPWAWLAETADELRYRDLRNQLSGVTAGTDDPAVLRQRLAELVGRHGVAVTRDYLNDALANLRRAVSDHPLISALARELERLEKSYV